MLTLDNWIKANRLEGLQDDIQIHIEELTTAPDPSTVRCIMISIRQRFEDTLDLNKTIKEMEELEVSKNVHNRDRK